MAWKLGKAGYWDCTLREETEARGGAGGMGEICNGATVTVLRA